MKKFLLKLADKIYRKYKKNGYFIFNNKLFRVENITYTENREMIPTLEIRAYSFPGVILKEEWYRQNCR